MKYILLPLLLYTLTLPACAQTRTGIKRAFAFFQVSFPGNIPVDDNGKPLKGPDTLRFIYIECAGKSKPEINTVQYNGRVYDASVFPAEKTPVTPGKKKGTFKGIVITPSRGNSLWKIELSSTQTQLSPRNRIIITGTHNGRPFISTIAKETELEPEIRY